MYRFLAELILIIIIVPLLRSVLGSVMKSFGNFVGRPNSVPAATPAAPRAGGDLHRDPVCGTFVAESTPYERRVGQQTFYYCSAECRDKHARGQT